MPDAARGGSAPEDAVPGAAERGEAARGEAACEDAVRGEAARLRARLAVARDRLAPLLPHPRPCPGGDDAPRGDAAPRGGVAQFDDDDDNTELRALLGPAVTRISDLVALAGALAEGELTDESAAQAASAIADAQPHRRPR